MLQAQKHQLNLPDWLLKAKLIPELNYVINHYAMKAYGAVKTHYLP